MTELAENPQDSFDPCLARRCSARTIVDAAADGTLTADRITDLIAEAARAQSIATYTGELRQRTERLFVGAFYEALQDGAAESRVLADQRRRMLAGLAGQVVEIGAGNGLNFAHYPPDSDEGACLRARTVSADFGHEGRREVRRSGFGG